MGDKYTDQLSKLKSMSFPLSIKTDDLKITEDGARVRSPETIKKVRQIVVEGFSKQKDMTGALTYIKEALKESETGKWNISVWFDGMRAG